jgi:hypothetical protein
LVVTVQVIQARRSDLRALLSLGQDEGSLNHCLRVEGKARGSPVGGNAVLFDGSVDVVYERGRMGGDAPVANFADRRMRVVGFLNHGAKQASVLR